MGESEPLKDKFDPIRATSQWENVWGYIFHGKRPASFYVLPHWLTQKAHSRWVESIAVIFDKQFWLKEKIPDLWERSIKLLKNLATLGSPIYGYAHTWSEFEEKGFVKRVLQNGLVSSESVSLTPREGLVDLYWANLFGKPYIDIFGLNTLEKVGCPTKQQIQNGYLLVYGSNPFDWRLREVRRLQDRDKSVLNHGAFIDKTAGSKPNLKIMLS